PFEIGGTEFRYLSTGREGIAVDGSRNNQIRRNRLARNSAGGIFLYKNCGEYITQKPNQWWQRRYAADGNLIEANTISDEPNGIWIGSRMEENQIFLDCSDPVYVSGPISRIHLDYAAHNVVRRNRLTRVDNGIRVEDDGNRIEKNRFTS